MRIITGSARGAPIATPKGLATRPMTGRVRGAIFNILRDAIDEAEVLDLFAGSGSLGLEALSRGAARCLFVERNWAALRVLRRNVEALRFADRAQVLAGDAVRLADDRLQRGFDVVFVDPPYRLASRLDEPSEVARLLRNLCAGPMLKEATVVVVRTPRRAGALWLPEVLEVADEREYGADAVRFLRRRATSSAVKPEDGCAS